MLLAAEVQVPDTGCTNSLESGKHGRSAAREAYPPLKAAGDLLGREALLGQVQVLLSPIQHGLVDRRTQLHL